MAHSELIARVQAATGACRELDAALHEAFGLPFVMEYYTEYATEQTRNLSYVPLYTASIDSALTLVPEGNEWFIGYGATRPDEPLGGARILMAEESIDAEAATPALAICIASLRAIQNGG